MVFFVGLFKVSGFVFNNYVIYKLSGGFKAGIKVEIIIRKK